MDKILEFDKNTTFKQEIKMLVIQFRFLFITMMLFLTSIKGMPTQMPSSVSQLNTYFGSSPEITAISLKDATQLPNSVQVPSLTGISDTSTKITSTPFKNLFEQLPWLDEALFWLGGVLSDRIAKFIPQLIRKFILRREIAWIDMC